MESAVCLGKSAERATSDSGSDDNSPKEVEIVGIPFEKAIDLKPTAGGGEVVSDLSPEVPTVQ